MGERSFGCTSIDLIPSKDISYVFDDVLRMQVYIGLTFYSNLINTD